jgi:hypothetical protein
VPPPPRRHRRRCCCRRRHPVVPVVSVATRRGPSFPSRGTCVAVHHVTPAPLPTSGWCGAAPHSTASHRLLLLLHEIDPPQVAPPQPLCLVALRVGARPLQPACDVGFLAAPSLGRAVRHPAVAIGRGRRPAAERLLALLGCWPAFCLCCYLLPVQSVMADTYYSCPSLKKVSRKKADFWVDPQLWQQ